VLQLMLFVNDLMSKSVQRECQDALPILVYFLVMLYSLVGK